MQINISVGTSWEFRKSINFNGSVSKEMHFQIQANEMP